MIPSTLFSQATEVLCGAAPYRRFKDIVKEERSL